MKEVWNDDEFDLPQLIKFIHRGTIKLHGAVDRERSVFEFNDGHFQLEKPRRGAQLATSLFSP